jgi:hypothetical protein
VKDLALSMPIRSVISSPPVDSFETVSITSYLGAFAYGQLWGQVVEKFRAKIIRFASDLPAQSLDPETR